MKHEILSSDGKYAVTHSEEDGKRYIGNHADIDPIIKHVKKVRDMHEYSTKASNPNHWKHIGSVPIVIITDWCRRNGHTFDQWARNEGGAKCNAQAVLDDAELARDPGVKSQFMRFFLSRDFSKLHNEHVTTKSGTAQIVVPDR